jgi:hypothetical protein
VQPFSELSTENTESESRPCRRSRLYTLEVFKASLKERMLAVVAVLLIEAASSWVAVFAAVAASWRCKNKRKA